MDNNATFVRGRVLGSARDRWAAIACDTAVMATVGVAIYAALGMLA